MVCAVSCGHMSPEAKELAVAAREFDVYSENLAEYGNDPDIKALFKQDLRTATRRLDEAVLAYAKLRGFVGR